MMACHTSNPNHFLPAGMTVLLQIYLKYGMSKNRKKESLQLTCSPENEAAMFHGRWDINRWPLLTKLTCRYWL